MMIKKGLILIELFAVMAIVVMTLSGGCKKEDGPYPQRDVFVCIFSSQGGGTDTWIRQLSALMAKDLKVNMVCTNLPGAKGGTGAMQVWSSPHDGYSILGASETSVFFGVNDVAPMVDKWRFFIAGGSQGIFAVRTDSPYTRIEELAAQAKEQQGKIKVGNSGQGKLWHIKAVQLERARGGSLKHIPYNGSGPAITALLSKEVDAVSCSCAEIAEYVKAELVRPLVVTDVKSINFEGFGPVRSAIEIYPDMETELQNLFQWLGFMLPHDVENEKLKTFEEAFKRSVESPEFDRFLQSQMARKIAMCGKQADQLVDRMQRIASWTAKELGIARKDPEELGIPRSSNH
ncbi:MAG: tripartite tricarboxylate transporter substrate binding protein [Planctomycetota bacterium]|nr:MAG: tripartite tricarboxylate transporter substrate binding protein [Planctomycetota bacterium]